MRESFNSCYLPSVDPTAWAVLATAKCNPPE